MFQAPCGGGASGPRTTTDDDNRLDIPAASSTPGSFDLHVRALTHHSPTDDKLFRMEKRPRGRPKGTKNKPDAKNVGRPRKDGRPPGMSKETERKLPSGAIPDMDRGECQWERSLEREPAQR